MSLGTPAIAGSAVPSAGTAQLCSRALQGAAGAAALWLLCQALPASGQGSACPAQVGAAQQPLVAQHSRTRGFSWWFPHPVQAAAPQRGWGTPGALHGPCRLDSHLQTLGNISGQSETLPHTEHTALPSQCCLPKKEHQAAAEQGFLLLGQ